MFTNKKKDHRKRPSGRFEVEPNGGATNGSTPLAKRREIQEVKDYMTREKLQMAQFVVLSEAEEKGGKRKQLKLHKNDPRWIIIGAHI